VPRNTSVNGKLRADFQRRRVWGPAGKAGHCQLSVRHAAAVISSLADVYVKICGLRRKRDVACAVEAGADAIGFVFCDSPRQVTVAEARRLAADVPPDVLTVGVFLGVAVEQVREAALESCMRAVQLHGTYSAADFATLADLPVRLIRAKSVSKGQDLRIGTYGEEILILDSQQAGSGKTWDVSVLARTRPEGRWMLAGGLHPGNVAEAVAAVRPWGVDVSSGVEVTRGIKDQALIREFVAAARSCSASLDTAAAEPLEPLGELGAGAARPCRQP
jgi:phosphoribosylanthranilate isomerase